MSVRISISSYWTDFMVYLSIFRTNAEKAEVFVRSDKNNVHFIWRRLYIYDNISFSFFLELEMFQTKL
jgi:hypothetical protein